MCQLWGLLLFLALFSAPKEYISFRNTKQNTENNVQPSQSLHGALLHQQYVSSLEKEVH